MRNQLWRANVVRCALAILLGLAALQALASQTTSTQKSSTSVSVLLPPTIPSETAQVVYFMVGPFGGYGGYTEERAGLHSYTIVASVGGKAATELRMIVYASGCEIETFIVSLADDSRVEQRFECQPVQSVMLSGQIMPNQLVRDKNAELIITYMAFWAHAFFGIADGAVAEFRLATVSPDANGMFQVGLPRFSEDATPSSSQPRASLHLMLRDSKTRNPIAYNLEPDVPQLRSEDRSLRIRSDYPSGLKFTAGPF